MISSPGDETGNQAGLPSARLAQIGAVVGQRLATHPDVQKVSVDLIDLFVLPNFLDAAECAPLIAMIDADSRPSSLFIEGPGSDYRTSYSCDLDRWNDDVMAIDEKICALLGIDPRHGETLQGQRYAVGQQFKAHHDFFHINQPYWAEMEAHGGQRSWTAMVYLNAPEAGGETEFPGAGVTIAPHAGLLLAWNNMGADGAPNLRTLHAGLPVAMGTKYVVTKWFRERPWV